MIHIQPSIIKGFFANDKFLKIKEYVDGLAGRLESQPIQDQEFQRHHLHNDPPLVEVHQHLEGWLSGYLGRQIKKSYCFLSIYREGGICPLHTDRPQCEYTIDICISQREVWTIYIDGQPFTLDENDAVVYSGTKSPHYRNEIQEGNHCFLIFFHFVDYDFNGSLD